MAKELKERYFELLQNLNAEVDPNPFWKEIEREHNGKGRHYHNLSHLENLFLVLDPIRNLFADWDMIAAAVFYHDIVYNVRKKDNEEQSAVRAIERLKTWGVAEDRIQLCNTIIIATKSHDLHENEAVNLFTDADLAILGGTWKTYETYFKAIRKEYKIYPKLMYNPARKKVLQHFLDMPTIYKTKYFQESLEENARLNIAKELSLL